MSREIFWLAQPTVLALTGYLSLLPINYSRLNLPDYAARLAPDLIPFAILCGVFLPLQALILFCRLNDIGVPPGATLYMLMRGQTIGMKRLLLAKTGEGL